MELEDFDFKPMTKGLGFDKKAEEVKHSIIQSSIEMETVEPTAPISMSSASPEIEEVELPNKTPVSRSLQKMLDSLPPSVDFMEDKSRGEDFEPPKPTLKVEPTTTLAPNPLAPPPPAVNQPPSEKKSFDVTLNNSISNAFPKAEFDKPFFHQTVTPQQQFKEIPASLASSFIDFLITLGISALFVVSLIVITQIDVMKLLSTREMLNRTMIEISALYFGVAILYYMISRSLWGSTLGDWAFDVQLGTEKQRLHLMYPFQVLFRTIIIVATGVILVPLVSLGFGRDIAEKFSGLKLYFRQY